MSADLINLASLTNKKEEISWELGLPVTQVTVGKTLNCSYFLVHRQSFEVILIDAPIGIKEHVTAFTKRGYTLKAILLTHSHYDHVLGLKELEQLPPIYIHEGELFRFQNLFSNQELLKIKPQLKPLSISPQQALPISLNNFNVKVHSTPGHSVGALMFEWENFLFTGDTLFIGTCGRTDFETGSDQSMYESFQYLKLFSEKLILCPGHRYSVLAWNTLEDEKKTSPLFQCQSAEELAALP